MAKKIRAQQSETETKAIGEVISSSVTSLVAQCWQTEDAELEQEFFYLGVSGYFLLRSLTWRAGKAHVAIRRNIAEERYADRQINAVTRGTRQGARS